jgi:hypothetical protein
MSAAPCPACWDSRLDDLVREFEAVKLPASSFRLDGATEVADPRRYADALRRDIEGCRNCAASRALVERLATLLKALSAMKRPEVAA